MGWGGRFGIDGKDGNDDFVFFFLFSNKFKANYTPRFSLG